MPEGSTGAALGKSHRRRYGSTRRRRARPKRPPYTPGVTYLNRQKQARQRQRVNRAFRRTTYRQPSGVGGQISPAYKRGQERQRRLNRGELVGIGKGRWLVQTAGGRTRTVTKAQYRRMVTKQQYRAVQRAIEARRQGYDSIAQMNRANRLQAARPAQARIGPVRLPIATGTLGRYGRVLGRRALVVPFARGAGQLGARAATTTARDIKDLVENTPIGIYRAGRAAYYAGAKQDVGPARELFEEYKETSPVALAAQGRFKEAGTSVIEHPLFAGLEVYGGAATGLRLAGRAGRRARTGSGHPERKPDRTVQGTKIAQHRMYGKAAGSRFVRERAPRIPGTTLGGVQARRRKTADLVKRGKEARRRGNEDAAADYFDRAVAMSPDRAPDTHIEHWGNVYEGRYQSQRRPNRSAVDVATMRAQTGMPVKRLSRIRAVSARRAKREGRPEPVVELVAQGIINADPADAADYLKQLDAEAAQMKKTGAPKVLRQENNRTRAALQAAVKGEVDWAGVAESAQALGRLQQPLTKALTDAKILDPDEAERARLGAGPMRGGVANVEGAGIVRDPDRVAEAVAVRSRIEATLEADERKQGGLAVGSTMVDEDAPPLSLEERAALERQHQEATQIIRDSKVSTEQLREFARARGFEPEDIAFMSHRPGAAGPGAYNVSGRRAVGIAPRTRGGGAVRKGIGVAAQGGMRAQNVRMQAIKNSNDHYQSMLDDVMLRDPKTGEPVLFKHNNEESRRRLQNMLLDEEGDPIPEAHEFTLVKAQPFAGRPEQLKKALEEADDEGFVGRDHPVSEAIEDALKGKGNDEGGWVAIPKVLADNQAAHAAVVRSIPPLIRVWSQMFRRTVLPISLPWLTGNFAEGGVRTAIFGSVPGDKRIYNNALVELAKDPKGAKKAEQMIHSVPTGHYGGVSETMIHHTAQQFGNGRMGRFARMVDRVGRMGPGPITPRNLARTYVAYTDWIMGTMNPFLESQWSRRMAGTHIRRELMNPAERKATETAIEQAARGLRKTSEQIRMADVVRRAFGQYDSFPPGVRKWVLTFTPFGAWTFNAMKFLTVVLPQDHPALTAAFAAMHQMTEDWRNEQGLDEQAEKPLPPFLLGSIPMPGGGHLRVARYTPWGVGGDPLGVVASNVLPYMSGFLMASRGLDWKGDELVGKGGRKPDTLEKLGIGARETIYASVPGLGMINRFYEKEGSGLQRGGQVINPFGVVKPREDKRKKKKRDLGTDLEDIDGAIEGDENLDEDLKKIDKALGLD